MEVAKERERMENGCTIKDSAVKKYSNRISSGVDNLTEGMSEMNDGVYFSFNFCFFFSRSRHVNSNKEIPLIFEAGIGI